VAIEKTIIKVMRLPEGEDWKYYGDLNVIAVSDQLDEAGQMVAILDLQAHWRRSMIHVVEPRQGTEGSKRRGKGAPFSFFRNHLTATDG
jgi:hypothetical protein